MVYMHMLLLVFHCPDKLLPTLAALNLPFSQTESSDNMGASCYLVKCKWNTLSFFANSIHVCACGFFSSILLKLFFGFCIGTGTVISNAVSRKVSGF